MGDESPLAALLASSLAAGERIERALELAQGLQTVTTPAPDRRRDEMRNLSPIANNRFGLRFVTDKRGSSRGLLV
jgi:hypothetical protein